MHSKYHFLIGSGLLVAAFIGAGSYVFGYRQGASASEEKMLVAYANILGEEIIEINAIHERIESEELDEYARNRNESFIIMVGCGLWYPKIKAIADVDLKIFHQALDLAENQLDEDALKDHATCLENIHNQGKYSSRNQ